MNDDSLWVCGDNTYGQLGTGNNNNLYKLQKIMDDVKAISCGYNHSLVIKKDNTIYGTGDSSRGQLGINESSTNIFIKLKIN